MWGEKKIPPHPAFLTLMALRWLRPIPSAEFTSILLSDLSIVFPLETSILLERLPLERERYKNSGLHLYV